MINRFIILKKIVKNLVWQYFFPIYFSITRGWRALRTPNLYYVIYGQPLTSLLGPVGKEKVGERQPARLLLIAVFVPDFDFLLLLPLLLHGIKVSCPPPRGSTLPVSGRGNQGGSRPAPGTSSPPSHFSVTCL